MKRFLSILVCLVLVFSVLLVPCLASPSPDPYPYPFILPSSYQNAQALDDNFYSVSGGMSSSSFTFTLDDVEDFVQYGADSIPSFVIYPLFVDISGNPIFVPVSLFHDTEYFRLTRFYSDGTNPESISIDGTSPVLSLLEDDFDDSRRTYYFVFSFNSTDYMGDPDNRFIPSKVAFISIPITFTSDYISIVNSSYFSPISYGQGYQSGYNQGEIDGANASWQDGFDKGFNKGQSDLIDDGYMSPQTVEELTSTARLEGKREGFALGEQSDVTKDIKSTILYAVSSPFIAINNALQFEVLGVNLASLFFVIFTCVVLAFVLKKFVL